MLQRGGPAQAVSRSALRIMRWLTPPKGPRSRFDIRIGDAKYRQIARLRVADDPLLTLHGLIRESVELTRCGRDGSQHGSGIAEREQCRTRAPLLNRDAKLTGAVPNAARHISREHRKIWFGRARQCLSNPIPKCVEFRAINTRWNPVRQVCAQVGAKQRPEVDGCCVCQ